MQDDLNIVLSSQIDMEKSVRNIDKQIKTLQDKIKELNISINIDGIDKVFKDMAREATKQMGNTKVYDSKDTKKEIDETIKDFNQLQREIDRIKSEGFKKGKVSTSFVDIGDGDKLKKITTEYNDELSNTIKIVEYINTQTGETISIEKVLTDNIKKRTSEVEKLANKIGQMNEKSQQKVIKQDRKDELAQQKAINKAIDDEYESNKRLETQIREINLLKKEAYARIDNVVKNNDGADLKQADALRVALSKISPEANDARLQIRELNAEIKSYSSISRIASINSNSFSDSLKRFTAFYGIYDILQLSKRAISDLVGNVFELNRAMTELNKTSDLPNMDKFIQKSYELSTSLAKTGSEVVLAASEFSKAGFGESEQMLLQLSESALMLINIGDSIDNISDASKTLVSSMRGFNTTDSQKIIDIANAVSNASGSNMEDIAFALQRVSGTLGSMGVSMESSVAAFSTINEILQSAEVSSTGLSSLFLRMRGLSEDTGESIDGLVPKLQDLYASIGINYTDENGQLRDQLSILKDLSLIWDDLTINQQAYISQESAGLRQAKVFNTLVSNFSRYEELLGVATTSMGSAAKENDVFLQSLSGRLQGLKSEIEALANESVSEDFLKSLISITTNIVSMTREIGGLIPVAQTLVGLLIIIRAQSVGKFIGDMVTSMSGLATSMKNVMAVMTTLATGTQSLNGAMTALGISTKTLAAGGIGLLITAIGALSMHSSHLKKEMEENIRLSEEMAGEYSSSAKSIGELRNEYDRILNTYSDQKQMKEELKSLQDKLIETFGLEAKGIDLVNGSIEEQLYLLDEMISSKNKMAIQFADDDLRNTMSQQALNTKGSYFFNNNSFGELSDGDKKAIQEIANEINKEFKNAMSTSFNDDAFSMNSFRIDSYNIEAQEKLLTLLKTTKLENKDVYNSFKQMYQDNTKWIDEVAEKQRIKNELVAQEIAIQAKSSSGITSYSKATEQQYDNFVKKTYEIIDATKDDADTKNLLKAEMDKLTGSAFPQFVNANEDIIDSFTGLSRSLEEVMGDFDKVSDALDTQKDKIATYNELMQKMQEGTYLTAEEMYNLVDSNAELAPMLEEVDGMYRINIDSLGDLRDAAIQTTKDKIKADLDDIESVRSKTMANIQSYGIEIESLKSLSEARQALSSSINNVMGGSGSTADKYNQLLSQGLLSKDLDDSLKSYYEIDSKYKEIQAKMKALENMSFGTKSSSSDSKKGDKLSDTLKLAIEKIQKHRKDLENEIGILNEQMSLAEITGNNDGFDKIANQLTVKLKELHNIAQKEIDGFEGLKLKFKTDDEQLELNNLISQSTQKMYSDEAQYIQYTIDLLNQKYDAEKRSYDDKVRDIELQQALVEEGSEEHLALEQQKIDLLLKMQQSYLEKVRQLKELGLSQDQEDVRKYVDMYYNAEMEILNMQKAMAEKAKAAKLEAISKQIDQYEEQKKAQQDIFEMTMKMIKAEHEARKKALQDEIKGYEKIINKKKEALRDEYDKENAADELAEKQKVLDDIEKQLLMLDGVEGEDAKAKRIKLEEEKAKAIKDIDKFNREQLLQGQEDLLDKELENFKDKKEEEIKEIDDYLSKEGNIRDEALKRMDKKNKALYEQLKKYSSDYSTISGQEFDKLWSTANQSIEGYTDKNLTLLDTMKLVTEELEKQKELHTQVGNSSWQDNVPNGNAGGSQTNSNVKVIQQMMANSNKWTNATQEEKTRLADDNQRLGNSIGAYYENGVWYTDKTKKKKLYDSIIGVYHKGGIVGGNTSLKSSEEFAKLLKGEVVASIPQIDNFMNKTLPRISNGGGGVNISLSIEKLIDVDKLDNNVDIESITKRAINGVMKQLNSGFRNNGLRPSW